MVFCDLNHTFIIPRKSEETTRKSRYNFEFCDRNHIFMWFSVKASLSGHALRRTNPHMMRGNIKRLGIGPENPEALRRQQRKTARCPLSGRSGSKRNSSSKLKLDAGEGCPPPRGAKRRRGRNPHRAPPPSYFAPDGEIISRPGQRPSQKTSKSTPRSSSPSDENAASAASEYGRDAGEAPTNS